MFARRLTLPPPGACTFFLWGPRQVGKTTLPRQCYPDAFWVDLLKAAEFRRYATRPESLRLALQAEGPDPARQVVVDEVMKVPPCSTKRTGFLEQLRSGALLGWRVVDAAPIVARGPSGSSRRSTAPPATGPRTARPCCAGN